MVVAFQTPEKAKNRKKHKNPKNHNSQKDHSGKHPSFHYYFASGRFPPRNERSPAGTAYVKLSKTQSKMEYLNLIEVRGRVGNVSIKQYGEGVNCRFSVISEYAYKDRNGEPVIDSVWFNCTGWEGRNIQDLEQLRRGMIVHLTGRIRTYKFTNDEGTDISGWEILVNSLKVEEDDVLQPQRSL